MDGIIHVLKSYDFTVLPEEPNSVIDTRFPDQFLISNHVSEFVWDRSFVAEHDGEIVGFCHYTIIDQHSAQTRLLAVLPEHQSLGLGKQLQIARMKAAYGQGIEKLHTHSEHPKSIEWYKKHFGYIDHGSVESLHGLLFFRLPDRVVWGLHYGFQEYPVLRKLVCNLPQYFSRTKSQKV